LLSFDFLYNFIFTFLLFFVLLFLLLSPLLLLVLLVLLSLVCPLFLLKPLDRLLVLVRDQVEAAGFAALLEEQLERGVGVVLHLFNLHLLERRLPAGSLNEDLDSAVAVGLVVLSESFQAADHLVVGLVRLFLLFGQLLQFGPQELVFS